VATVANVTAGLTAVWNASTNTLCTGVTASDETTYVKLTADTAGTPFNVASSTTEGGGNDTQTLVRAVVTACDGPNYRSTAANWTDSTAPVTGDTAVFDGRTTASCLYDMDATGVDLAAMVIRSSYTGDIGTAGLLGVNEGPLIFECSGQVLIEGTGNYYLQCGNDVADADIASTIINTNGGYVELSSQKNAAAGNISAWTRTEIVQGTLLVTGDADAVATNAQSGTYIGELWVAATANRMANVTVIIGDQCYDQKNSAYTDLYMTEGMLTCYSALGDIIKTGGRLIIGGTGYSMTAVDDTWTSFVQTAGQTYWHPSNVTASAEVKAAPAPVITSGKIFGGDFDASGMLETDTTAPTITALYVWPRATVTLNNGYSNIVVTDPIHNYGGTITLAPGQSVSFG